MVDVTFIKERGRGYCGAKILNHAGDEKICSAVSALGMTLIGALQRVPNIHFEQVFYEHGQVSVFTRLFLDEEAQKEVDTIYQTIWIGLKQLEATYPENLKVL